MFSAPRVSFALVALASFVAISPCQAQHTDPLRITFPMGLSPLEPATSFGDAYDGGGHLGVALALPVGRRLWLRVGFERHWFPYDRVRFFQRMGIEQVDLEGQFGEGAEVDWWSVGSELTVWERRTLGLYSLASVGRAVRRSRGALVWMYSSPRNLFSADDAGVVRTVPYVPPASCQQARSETAIAGSAFGLHVGGGMRLGGRGRWYGFVESGVMGWFLTPAMATIPLRAGHGFAF